MRTNDGITMFTTTLKAGVAGLLLATGPVALAQQSGYCVPYPGQSGTVGANSGGVYTWDLDGSQVYTVPSGSGQFTVTHPQFGESYQASLGNLSGNYVVGGRESYLDGAGSGNSVYSGMKQFQFALNGQFRFYKAGDAAIIYDPSGTGACTTPSSYVEGIYGTFVNSGNGQRQIVFLCTNGVYSVGLLSPDGTQMACSEGYFRKM